MRERGSEEAVLDCTLFRVDRETYDRFVAALDGSAEPNEKLRKLLTTRAAWD